MDSNADCKSTSEVSSSRPGSDHSETDTSTYTEGQAIQSPKDEKETGTINENTLAENPRCFDGDNVNKSVVEVEIDSCPSENKNENVTEVIQQTVDESDPVCCESGIIEGGGECTELSKQRTVKVEIQDNVSTAQSMAYRQTDADGSGASMDSDSDSDDSSSSDTSDDSSEAKIVVSDEEKTKKIESQKKDTTIQKRKGEFQPEDLPPLEELKITADEAVVMVQVGTVTSLIGVLAVVQSHADVQPLDDNTILFLENRKAIGQVFEIFGPVHAPWYSVRFNSVDVMTEMGITVGLSVYCAPKEEQYTHYVFVSHLKHIHGSDASWENDNEPPRQHMDYSDDDEEKRSKSKRNKDVESKEGDEMQTKLQNKKARRNANKKTNRGGNNRPQGQRQNNEPCREPYGSHDSFQTGSPNAWPRQQVYASRGGFHGNTAPNPFQLGHQQSNQFPRQPLTQWPPKEPRIPINSTCQRTSIPNDRNDPPQYLSPTIFQFRGRGGHPINRPPLRSPFSDEMNHNMQDMERNNSCNSFRAPNMNLHPRGPAVSTLAPRIPFPRNDNPSNFQPSFQPDPMCSTSPRPPNKSMTFSSPYMSQTQQGSIMDNRLVQNDNTNEFSQKMFVNPTFGGQPQFNTGTMRPGSNIGAMRPGSNIGAMRPGANFGAMRSGPRQFFHRGQHY